MGINEKERQEMIYEIMSILAKHNLSINESKELLDKVNAELLNLIPWHQLSMNIKSQE